MSPSFTKIIKPRQSDGSLYRCPCCNSPTLETRGGDEICRVCIWQDDGQDDPFADEAWGGPNGKLSLTEARENFRQCGAYDPRIGRDPSTRGRPVPEVPPPTFPPPPRPPPWWARLSRRQQIILVGEGVALLLISLFAYWLATGRLTGQMVKHRDYYLWAHEHASYKPEYVALFAHDPALQRHFLGKPVDTLHRFFPWVYYGSARYAPDSLRLVNPGHSFPAYQGARIQVYRLDPWQPSPVYSVLIVDGQIRDFFFTKH